MSQNHGQLITVNMLYEGGYHAHDDLRHQAYIICYSNHKLTPVTEFMVGISMESTLNDTLVLNIVEQVCVCG